MKITVFQHSGKKRSLPLSLQMLFVFPSSFTQFHSLPFFFFILAISVSHCCMLVFSPLPPISLLDYFFSFYWITDFSCYFSFLDCLLVIFQISLVNFDNFWFLLICFSIHVEIKAHFILCSVYLIILQCLRLWICSLLFILTPWLFFFICLMNFLILSSFSLYYIVRILWNLGLNCFLLKMIDICFYLVL